MSSKDNLALDLEHGVRRWDRPRWISVFSSHSPTIREVTECLGLGLSASSSTTNRGIPKFDNPDYRKISSEVTKLSKELPKERDALLDFAADPLSLDTELEELLATYGPAIWGREADRSCLLTPDPTKKTYNRDLFYEESEHKEILKIHLHRWIIIKACYYIRNMKLKRPSGINDYDTLADIDGEGGSQHGTPQSHSPPELNTSGGAELEVKLSNLKKRKSSAHLSLSDGEGQSSTPAKRPYNTMPFGKRSASPRKSLKSIIAASPGSSENMPPLPSRPASHTHPFSPPLPSATEAGRVQLSPLSSNERNGMTGSPVAVPVSNPTGFTAVNPGGFTTVNSVSMTSTAPLVREPSRESPQETARDSKQSSPTQHHRDSRAYTSPYDTASYSTTTTQNTPDHRSAPPPNSVPTAGQGFQAVNSPTITNGRDSREPSEAQSAHHTYVAPQSQPQLQPQPTQQTHTQHHPWSQSQAQTHTLPQPHAQTQQQPTPRSPGRNHAPSGHHVGRSLAPHPSSRSNTPLAPAASAPSNMTPNAQTAPAHAPNIQTSLPHNIKSAPAQTAHATPNSHPPLPHLQPSTQNGHPISHPHAVQPVLKSQPVESTQVGRPVAAAIDIRLLQCEVLALLIQYLFPKTGSPPDEAAVLTRISYLWYHGEVIFRTDLGAHYDLSSKILNAWLHERQAISSLRHSLSAQPGISSSGLMDRLLAMNDLRVMRLKWKNMSTLDGASPEDLLCRVFAIMANTENTEHLFRDGLERLNRGVFEFLRSEDAKIVMHRQ